MISTRQGRAARRWVASRWTRTAIAVLVTMQVVLGMPVVAGPGPADGAAGASAAQAGPDGASAGPPDVLPADQAWTVTLLTGDVLDVRSDAEGRVTAAARERRGPFRTVRTPEGELYVIPLSVTPLLDEMLDLELFNVTGLVRQGYDDASLDVVPLIVQRQPGTDVARTLSTAPEERPLPSIGAVATEVPKADATATGELLADLGAATDARAPGAGGVIRIWLDRQVTTLSAGTSSSPRSPAVPAPPPSAATPPAPSSALTPAAPSPAGAPPAPSSAGAPAGPAQGAADLDPNLPQVGADRAWAAGFTGEGVTVAVLDTGVDSQHPDLAGKVVAEENFGGSPDAEDRYGHGTHVAALVAGTGAGAAGARSGVAPGARLISGKVLDDEGYGFESEAIAGMEWAAPQADVVNMSLGYGQDSDGSDPLSLALDALSDQHDTLFVVAAGNSGPLSRSVDFPGAADRALTVGAVDSADELAEFSSRGPLNGSYELKPEVLAPGVDVVAARAAGTSMGEPVDELYTRASGTSMAAPHVAGAAAILAQQHADWSAAQIKNSLVGTSDAIEGDAYDVGAGRIDVGDGVEATVRAERDVVDVPLPHPRTAPHTETLTWTNTGTEPRTVSLDVDLEDRQGDPVDAVSVEPAEITVAPGATGTATLTVEGPELDTGLYSGIVTADPDDSADGADGAAQDDLRTPIAVHAAAEMVDLTIQTTAPPDVRSTLGTFAAVVNLDDYAVGSQFAFFESDTHTLSVPAGRYAVIGDMSAVVPEAQLVMHLGDPDVEISEPTTVVFDGAAAVPFHPTVSGVDTAPPMYSSSGLVITPAHGTAGFGLLSEIYAWHPAPPVHLTAMEGDPDLFAAYQVYRLQAAPLTVGVGGETAPVTRASDATTPAPGQATLPAVDAGDGRDLSGARDRLAVVRLPDDVAERAAVTRRAIDAGVAVLAFVDPERRYLDLDGGPPDQWAAVPTIVAPAGPASELLLDAAATGEQVTVTVAASPYVYDIVSPDSATLDPEPVLDRAEQRQLATLRERFHRDPDGRGAQRDQRYSLVNLMDLDSEGPLPERRTAHVSPDLPWQSMAVGAGFMRSAGELVPGDTMALSIDAGPSYAPGSRTTVRWLRRPLWPGPVGGPRGKSPCQPTPVQRTPGTMQVWLAPFQDRRDGFGCADPHTSTLTLERDGTVIGTAEEYFAEFDVPAEAGTYRLSYEQTGQGPYDHRSTTVWTFRSEAPAAGGAEQPIPLLVVDYRLPLDTLNRPDGRTATFVVDQVTGADREPIQGLQVWTSTDGGTTWRQAPAASQGDGEFQVTLPRVDRGTPVSLRVDAEDQAGNRIEQTLLDAYTG